MMKTEQAIIPSGASPLASLDTPTGDQRLDLTLDGAIAGWLHQNGYKPTRKASSRTGWEYAADLIGPHGYRVACQRQGLDLDSPDTRALRLIAQEWAATPKMSGKGIGRPVAHATHNRRLASVASFYHYARSNDLPKANPPIDPQTGLPIVTVVANPVEFVKRQRTQKYAGAQPLDQGDVQARLRAIDTTTLRGKRDLALLAVALNTGRRLAELQALLWGDVHLRENGAVARLTWRHMKGEKVAYDDLDPAVTDALLAWLYAAYGARIGSLTPTAPLWLPLQHGGRLGEERAMSHDAIRAMYLKRLNTGKVHTTRHTFAGGMLAVGAPITDLQERLGHESLETTGHYARALYGAKNPHAGKLAAYFGLDGAHGGRRPGQHRRVTRPLGNPPQEGRGAGAPGGQRDGND